MDPQARKSLSVRARTLFAGAALAALLATVVSVGVPAAHAQDDHDHQHLPSQHEQVRRERKQVDTQVDVLAADSAQLDATIDSIDSEVTNQEDLVVRSERLAADASRQAVEASAAAEKTAEEVQQLRDQLARLAVDRYVSPPDDGLMDRMRAESANVAARKEAFVNMGTQRAGDVLDQLRAAQHRLEEERAASVRAQEEAERRRAAAQAQVEDLVFARAEKQSLFQDLEARLNSKLGEAAALAAVDANLAAQLRAEQDALVERLREMAPPPPDEGGDGGDPGGPEPPTQPPPVLPSVPLTTVRGITVNSSIAGRLESMLAAAAADGISLPGSGYRSSESQIAFRRAHCGTSNYAIWQMPAWQCSPPTAIPGTSMHERGLAIDFSGIPQYPEPGNAKYEWLKANAASYGFYNLPSEGWHWSTTGG